MPLKERIFSYFVIGIVISLIMGAIYLSENDHYEHAFWRLKHNITR